MPNWCFNSGCITLKNDSGKQLFKKLAENKSQRGWFANVMPLPPEMELGIGSTQGKQEYMSLEWLEENSEFQGDFGTFVANKYNADRVDFLPSKEYLQYLGQRFGATNWYGFNINNYGCKWDVTLSDLSVGKKTIDFAFDSPWGPPLVFFKWLGQQGFDVEISYEEPGVAFCGSLSIIDGQETEEYYEGEDFHAQQLENGEEINYIYYSIEEHETFESWCEDNDLPENEKLQKAIKEYFENR